MRREIQTRAGFKFGTTMSRGGILALKSSQYRTESFPVSPIIASEEYFEM
jgi:hypothetical protein